MYSATPTDLMEQQKANLFRRAHLASLASSKVWRVRPRSMVVNGGRLMMVVDTGADESVVCARITGVGTLVVEGAAEQDLTPMDLAYSPRSLWPEQKDIPAEMLA
ncbi:MAG: hypothetical protein JWQ94_565, partial [Tardiphaga sp.]|nr:hypothetical protein [Tardiphaga sp.]